MHRRTFFPFFAGLFASIPFIGKRKDDLPPGIYTPSPGTMSGAKSGKTERFTLQEEATGKPVYDDEWYELNGNYWKKVENTTQYGPKNVVVGIDKDIFHRLYRKPSEEYYKLNESKLVDCGMWDPSSKPDEKGQFWGRV